MARVSERLVGRDAELAELLEAVSAPPAFVVVEGEAGIGKSRLVHELAGRVPQLLRGSCEPVAEPFPLAPVLEALKDVALPQRLNPVVGALAPVLPELASRLPAAPPPLDDHRAERHRLLRAASTLLGELGPSVLVVEDVQWADASTAEFLGYLAARMPPELSVVLTARETPLWEAFARMRPVRIALSPLPWDAVRELAAILLETAEVPETYARSLHELTAGIPFVVEEVVAAGSTSVPKGLRDALLPRFAALDEQTREVLGASAVLGLVPDEQVLAAVMGLDVATVVRALSRCHAAGLLYEGTGFRHELARQVVYQSVPAPTRRWLHQRVAEALRGVVPLPVAQIAHHYEQAGRLLSFVKYAEAAAELAQSRGDDAAAARYLVRAVEVPELAASDRVRLAAWLARAAVHGLAQSEAAPVLDRVLASVELEPSADGELRFLLGRLLRQQGEASRGYEEIARATGDLADRPDQLALALAILAVPDIVTGRSIAEHRARCAEAVAVAEASGEAFVVAAVGVARVSLLIEVADPSASSAMVALLATPAVADEPREHARACLNWAQAAVHVGEVALAERMLAECRVVAARAEHFRVNTLLDLVSASVDLVAGRFDGLLERVRALSTNEFSAASLETEYLLGAVLAIAGDPEEAERRLRAVVRTAERVGALWPLVPARSALARLLLASGRSVEAAAQASEGLNVLRAKGNWVWAGETVSCLVEASSPSAPAAVAEFAAGLAGVFAPAAQAQLAYCEGRMEEARDSFVRLRLPYEAARISERLGLLEGAQAYDSVGAVASLARVLREMRRTGVPVPYPWRGGRRSYGSALSPREREVAQLAASGHTNAEIAARLYVSPRTVESHVASALRKLGGQTRKDLETLLSVGHGKPDV